MARIEECVCRFHEGILYVDERFKADFQCSTDDDEADSAAVPCPALCRADSDSEVSEKILLELTRAVFPTCLSDQLALL